ncbi:bifunctional 5,10-methylene-tetrahydrofolate dehydrogenase/5,10-methylene-tetrahydrofolate cyclohydrolase [Candidatus Micrarchaeota archaeon CG08_land_8_20_14_0_20_49_17]|nr:MAG: bifunctional 5,10-methylene-tetrahydrofolate dehydrogenase/5,10-methylene-tetrahydrofolate cyclohydrolase [Candidatus Micrarchaeota archaeon CG08_land_8_20_14_0_20_49_17]HII53556.1 bifunctional 5,10-methylenetetrahydrofolate dehydrogenase/5,10-methenyltetrahydrofolate cyclohydrolase [Candidatus Micrarchaeota archaeon]
MLSCKEIADKIQEDVRNEITKNNYALTLSFVVVGNDPASKVYVSRKEKVCSAVGIVSQSHNLQETASEEDVIELVRELNEDEGVNGILVQLPLPRQINPNKVSDAISHEKDVDGITPINLGRLVSGDPFLVPCTPMGIMAVFEMNQLPIEGRHAVVIGRSLIVGKPISLLLQNKNATVTMCHSKTADLAVITAQADILIAAVGKPKFVTADMVKKDAVVIDVGINRVEDKLIGDVDYEAVKDKASFITPVPGGVGLLTVAMLTRNVLTAYKAQKNILL